MVEIGYAAKFKSKLLEEEGWVIREILRRGAFERNTALSDNAVLGEIAGDAGTSGQSFKRSVQLSNKAELSSAIGDIRECLVNNPAWAGQLTTQLEESRHDFPDARANISVYSPSTGVFTIFFATTRDDGLLYVPTYSIEIVDDGLSKRLYGGELAEAKEISLPPTTFKEVLAKYYDDDIGSLVMTMTWGGYEARDAEVLDDLNLDYTSFRCDVGGDGERTFFRASNSRWRKVGQIEMFGSYTVYLERNKRLVRIINEKLGPRIGPGMCDGSSARRQLEDLVVPAVVQMNEYYSDPPDACGICECPLSLEPFMSNARVKGHQGSAIMCADCTVYHAEGIGWGVGQLYRNEGKTRWLLVAGARLEVEQS